jgi:hypothetical protein
MNRPSSRVWNILAFSLLAFALYLNFIHKNDSDENVLAGAAASAYTIKFKKAQTGHQQVTTKQTEKKKI